MANCVSMMTNMLRLYKFTTGLDIGYVPAVPHAFFRPLGQFGPQQFNLCWPAGPVAFDRFIYLFFFLIWLTML